MSSWCLLLLTRRASLLCVDFSRKPGSLICLQLVCSYKYARLQLRKKKQNVVAQGHCLDYTPCFIQQNISSAHMTQADRVTRPLMGVPFHPPKNMRPCLSPATPVSTKEFQVNHMWVMYSGTAKYDKMEFLVSSAACHGLSCCWYSHINHAISRHHSLQFACFLEHLNFSWTPCSWLLHTITQFPTAIAVGAISKWCYRGSESKPALRCCKQQLSQDCYLFCLPDMTLVK